MEKEITKHRYHFLQGGGEMGLLTREFDWSSTSLGNPDEWPQSLRTTLSIILNSKFPMFLFWGPEQICFYNDAYRPSLGNDGKHPGALGKNGEKVWPEIWPIIKPLIDQVISGGEATWSEDQLIPIYRNGRMEDVYWTFSYSPVNDESGKPAGVFVTCTETTSKINNLKQLEESKNQLQFAIEATELGTWDFNPSTGKFRGNQRLKEWFGLLPHEEIELTLAIAIIAEQDRKRVSDEIQKALLFASGGLYDITYTIIHPVLKNERIVRAKGRAWFDEKKIAYRFNGTLQDITSEAIAKKDLESRENQFRQLSEQLELKNSALVKINNDLDNFIYTASHDLKAPISNLEGLLYTFFSEVRVDKNVQPMVDMMFQSIERFKTTLKDLTEIVQVQKGSSEDMLLLNFADMLQEVTLNIKDLIEQNEVEIKSNFKVKDILYSRKNLRSILYNLISNSIKYAHDSRNPKIIIETESQNDYLVLTVQDNGMGMDAENKNKIFGMFKRLHDHVEGTGLGLYIIKRMIENAGGKIEVESEVGKGSTFTIYFKK